MRSRMPLVVVLCAPLLLGCGKDERTRADGHQTKPVGVDGGAKSEDDGPPKADGADEAQAEAGADAGVAEGAVADEALADCPASLTGKDTTDRVIAKVCGVVPVTGVYSVEGATLIIEAGASLAFAPGATMTVGATEPAKLVVRGTAAEPVTFTTSGDKTPGAWEGVVLHDKAAGSTLESLVIEHAGSEQAALRIEAADVTIAGSTIRGARAHGIEVAREGSVIMVGSTLEQVGPVAMRVTPRAAGGIQAGNTFPAGARVRIAEGIVDADTTWAAIGTPWLVTDRVQVHGEAGRSATLTLAAGTELRFDGEGSIDVGYLEPGGLEAQGSAAAPIVFGAHQRQEPGGWAGLRIYGKGQARLSHVRLEHGGRKDKEGALLIDDAARVSLQDVTFESDAVGVVVRGKKAQIDAFDRVSFSGTPIALRGPARVLGILGAANRYADEARIIAESDKIDADATWALQEGATLELDGRLQVSGGRLTLQPGITVHVADGGEVQVGYYDIAGLELLGTEEAPIRFVGQRDEPGAWGGLVFYGKAQGNVLSNVVLRSVGGQAGVRLDGEADATITNLRCDDCSTPTLKWSCKSTVEHTGVEAADGTPSALEAPECE